MKALAICLMTTVMCISSFASNLIIENTELQLLEGDQGEPLVSINLTIRWDNAWRNAKNHDAVWLFFKVGNKDNLVHNTVLPEGHEVINIENSIGPEPAFEVAKDSMGLFLFPGDNYRGSIHWTLNIKLSPAVLSQVQDVNLGHAYGLEMVYIPDGPFTLGDPFNRAIAYSSFYKSDEAGESKGLYIIDSENEIMVGREEDNLFYNVRQPSNQGDQSGPIPMTFPKGYNAFYIMKYEVFQSQYVSFLNSLTAEQSQNRANFGGKDYYQNRGGIFVDNGIYGTHKPDQPLNYCSWDDGMAFADWAGLRPLTEFEFTKAARGPDQPIARQFPWGTNSKNQIQRFLDEQGMLRFAEGLDESMLSDSTCSVLGASYYWVMDLAGSLWERVVTVGHETGRSFTGSHGDGTLGEYGFATNRDWPSGIRGEGGIGFRGGGHYQVNQNYGSFFPHSPIAYRPYGAWHGWNRTMAYGQRFVRTAKK